MISGDTVTQPYVRKQTGIEFCVMQQSQVFGTKIKIMIPLSVPLGYKMACLQSAQSRYFGHVQNNLKLKET